MQCVSFDETRGGSVDGQVRVPPSLPSLPFSTGPAAGRRGELYKNKQGKGARVASNRYCSNYLHGEPMIAISDRKAHIGREDDGKGAFGPRPDHFIAPRGHGFTPFDLPAANRQQRT